MQIVRGNLWDYFDTHKLVVTTNVGWDPETLYNNMGAGVALQAMSRYPHLRRWYGMFCKETAPDTPVVEHPSLPLVFMPVKPLLDPEDPERSWNQLAKVETIVKGLRQLREVQGKVALTFPGCGNGGLSKRRVLPLLGQLLDDDRFLVVDRSWKPGFPCAA